MQHDTIEQRSRIEAAFARAKTGPQFRKMVGWPLVPPADVLTMPRQSILDRYAGVHPLLARELTDGVHAGKVIQTLFEWFGVFDDELGRDWLPYSSD